MTWTPSARAAALAACAAALGAPAASPARAATSDFYAGKTITILVSSSPSGPNGYAQNLGRVAGTLSDAASEAYARTFARFFGSHIPGAPRVATQSLPGSGGLASLRSLEARAPKDGSALAAFDPAVTAEAAIGAFAGAADFSQLSWIGSMTPDFQICYAARAAGVRSWDALGRGRTLAFGAAGLRSLSYLDAQTLRALFARRVRPILGYLSRNDVYFAIARGELDGGCGPIADLPPAWVREGRINPLVRFVKEPLPGFAASPPYLGDLAQSGAQRGVVGLLAGADELGRPLVVARQTPPDRLALLRQAFAETMRDPRFLAAMASQDLSVAPTGGAQAERIAARLFDVPPDVAQAAKALATPPP